MRVYLCLLSLFVINIGYLLNHTFTHFGNYVFMSHLFQTIQRHFGILKNFPMPIPYPYLQGLDLNFRTDTTGSRYGNIYLLGQIHSQW